MKNEMPGHVGPDVVGGYARVLVCITFHFVAARIHYLVQVVKGLADLAVADCDVVVCTNSVVSGETQTLIRACGKLFHRPDAFRVVSFTDLETPRSLPWSHKALFRAELEDDTSRYTHFLYLEDDIFFSPRNFLYFLHYRDLLRPHGLLPGFVRVEFNGNDLDYFLSDQHGIGDLSAKRRVQLGSFALVNIDVPYAAMSLMDREMLAEHFATRSADMHASKDVIGWGRPERASLGLTYEAVPSGFESRLVSPIEPARLHPAAMCWVHHLPANYTNNYQPGPNFHLGKVRVDDGFVVKW